VSRAFVGDVADVVRIETFGSAPFVIDGSARSYVTVGRTVRREFVHDRRPYRPRAR
jgi:hypothetical protein